ncbi:hypothetical protein DJ018_05615 [Phenylobacterium deserti]|uniref:Uncharacterized protein n=2 Tax=Phenylobacterium deserti TaxID=1914756 RepID=A0A328AX35_9CAUL|nr:hypothetical protein DJ018_05615 [Phenylobacterium deserti]
MGERHGRMLARLAEWGMNLAERLHDEALAAETPAEAAEAALAFQRVSRSVRQSLALEARLARDAHLREAADRAQADQKREQRRREVYRAAVSLVWNEVDPSEDEFPDWDLAAAAAAEALSQEEGFLARQMPELIEQIRESLGVDELEAEEGSGDAAPSDDPAPQNAPDAPPPGWTPADDPALAGLSPNARINARRGWPPSPCDEGWDDFFEARRDTG